MLKDLSILCAKGDYYHYLVRLKFIIHNESMFSVFKSRNFFFFQKHQLYYTFYIISNIKRSMTFLQWYH